MEAILCVNMSLTDMRVEEGRYDSAGTSKEQNKLNGGELEG